MPRTAIAGIVAVGRLITLDAGYQHRVRGPAVVQTTTGNAHTRAPSVLEA